MAYAKLRSFDRRVRRRNLALFVLAVLSIFGFMAEIWLAYDPVKCWSDWPTPDINPLTQKPFELKDIDYRLKNCLTHTGKTTICKLYLSSLTIAMVLVLANYYYIQLKAETRYWYIQDSMLWRRHIGKAFLLEMLVILPHPAPLGSAFENAYDDKLGALMFMRLYTVIRVLRDLSPIYKSRGRLLKEPGLKRSGAVEFNWLLAVRFLFADAMWTFVIIGVVSCWFMWSYLVWIFEREHNINFKLDISVWMIVITMCTVGYGDWSPKYGISKILTGFAAITGIINTALLAFVVMKNLTLSSQDRRVQSMWARKECQADQKITAVSYIARAWQFYQEKRAAGFDPKVRAYQKARKSWNQENAIYKSHLRDLRRTFNMTSELDDLVADRLEEKIPKMTEDIASMLGERLGLPPSKSGECNNSLGMLGSLATRLNGIEEEQEVASREIDKLLDLYSSRTGWW